MAQDVTDYLEFGRRARAGRKAPTLLEELEAEAQASKPLTLLEELEREAQAPTVGERVQGFGANLVRGAGAVASGVFLETPAILGRKIAGALAPEGVELQPEGENKLNKLAAGARKGLDSLVPQSVEQEAPGVGRFLNTTLPQALGSTGGFVASGGAAGLTGAAIAGAASNGAAAYHEARYSGASEDTAWTAYGINAGLGTLEAAGIGKIIARFTGGEAGGAIRAALLSGSEEGITEGIQQIGGNLAASELYDPDREALEGVVEGGAAGFLSGVLLSALGSGIGAARGAGDQVADAGNMIPAVVGIAGRPAEQNAQDTQSGPLPAEPVRDLTGNSPPPNAADVALLDQALASDTLAGRPSPVPTEDRPGVATVESVEAAESPAPTLIEELEAEASGKPSAKVRRTIEDGMVTTQTGRKIPAPPGIRLTSNRAAQNDLKKLDGWLLDQGLAEAAARRDEHVSMLFGFLDSKRLTTSDRDSLNDYLFDETYPEFHPAGQSSADVAEASASPEAQAEPTLIEDLEREAFPWEDGEEAPPLKDPAVRDVLKWMASESGWAEQGGKLVLDPATREVTGRTKWMPKAEWWLDRPAGVTEKRVKKVVEKVLQNPDAKLGEGEARIIDWLLAHAQGELAPQFEPGMLGAPKTPKRAPHEEAYDAELQASREASQAFNAARDQYRARKIGDEEFLAARSAFEASNARFDAAQKTFEADGKKARQAAKRKRDDAQGALFSPATKPRAKSLPAELGAPQLPGGGLEVQPPAGETKIGGNLPGTLERTQPGSVAAPDVVKALSNVTKSVGMQTPIRQGRMGRTKAQGIFKVEPEVVRMRVANDIAVASHEVAHAFEKQVFGLGQAATKADKAARLEIMRIGAELYPGKPAKLTKAEGFAEFMRMYFTSPEEAKGRAPAFSKWFEESFLPSQKAEVRSAIASAKESATTWRLQGSRERANRSVVDTGSITERIKRLQHTASRFLSFEAHIDSLEPLRVLSKEASEIKSLKPAEDPHFVADALRLTHDARTEQMVSRSMIDLAGNPIGPSLKDVTAPIRGRYRDFVLYLVAKRAKALWEDPKHAARNPGLSLEDANQILTELGSPEFERAAAGVYGWYDGVMDYASEASPEFARIAEKIRKADPGSYIPLQRVFDAAEADFLKRGQGVSAKGGSLSARLRGSGRQIKDPFPALIAKARTTILQAHQRRVLDNILALSKLEGFGHLVEGPLPKNLVPVQIRAEDALRELEQQFGEERDPEKHDELAGEMFTFFMPTQQGPKGADPIFPVFENGEVKWYELDGRLFRTLEGLDTKYLNPWVHWTLGLQARTFRLGTTGLRASFSLVTNPLRDVQTMYLNTRSRRSALPLLANWAERNVRALVNAATLGKITDPMADAWLRLGGQMSQSLGQDVQHTRRAARQLFQGPKERLFSPLNLYDGLRELLQFPESATRTAELVEVSKQIGWKPGEPMSFAQSLELLRAGKQVTTDFTAAGNVARVMNQIVPFYNAAIQGPRATLRAAKRSPGRFTAKVLALSAASLLLWWEHKDEDWYIEKEAREKFAFWFFPFERNGELELVKIPRTQDVGAIAGIVEALMDSWYREDPKSATEFFETAMAQSNPVGAPPIAEELAEQLHNKDFYTDAPIVPRYGPGSEQGPDEEQFGDYTTRAAIVMGDLFGLSPRRIDHAIRGMGGPVAGDIFELLGLGPPDLEREPELADTPIAGRLFERGGAMGSHPRSVSELYDALDEALRMQHSERVPETEEKRQVRLMLDDAAKAVSALSAVRARVTDASTRRKLSVETSRIAQEAAVQVKSGELVRDTMAKARTAAQNLKKTTAALDAQIEALRAKLDGVDAREAELIRAAIDRLRAELTRVARQVVRE